MLYLIFLVAVIAACAFYPREAVGILGIVLLVFVAFQFLVALAPFLITVAILVVVAAVIAALAR